MRKNSSRAIKDAHGEDENWGTAAWILEQALPFMVVEDYLQGRFPLYHLDLHYNNVLVDKDYNITGIIDKSDAQTVPLERFTITPEFTAENNAPKIAFADRFAIALKKRELASSAQTPHISDFINTPQWEVVYRCTYS